ncbi:hypothetical protein Dsin_018517 [Dipteronia sinensis]|uniref:BHLH domain-containing protein n=1 Tax=Dipteronia sinensis TaxID=43782 RepID=A0AAE0A5N0_9ROSI|nr:hypothetical protein Dsin_018517 [Dipteronia sinensis]
MLTEQHGSLGLQALEEKPNSAAQGRNKRGRKPRVYKNKEKTDIQRMTHIVVERNRRKQMNEHLAVLRSLMPESYVQKNDQASVVGGAIKFVKELEQLFQSLEAQKLQLVQSLKSCKENSSSTTNKFLPPNLAQFFVYHQKTRPQIPRKYITSKAALDDIEVTLIERHASFRIISRRSPKQLSKLVILFQSLHLSILHLNVTTMDPFVLYSISAKTSNSEVFDEFQNHRNLSISNLIIKGGCCWAYTTVAAIEGDIKIKKGQLLELSVQQLVDCERGSYGCEGGYRHTTFEYVVKNGIITKVTHSRVVMEYVTRVGWPILLSQSKTMN